MRLLEDYAAALKNNKKMLIIGTDSGGSVSLAQEALKKPIMVIIGNEAKGMSVKLKNLCDKIIQIPVSGKVNSLNVACAASIIIWEVYKNTNWGVGRNEVRP
jgi:TrmH family RNA methyltransferase